MKWLWRFLLISTGIALITQGMVVFGIGTFIVVLVDIIFKKNYSSVAVKILYFPITIIYWLGTRPSKKKKTKKSEPYSLWEMIFYDELFGDD